MAAVAAVTTIGAEPAGTAIAAVTDQAGTPAVTAGHPGIRSGVIAGPAVTKEEPAATAGGVRLGSGCAVANHATEFAGHLEQVIDVLVDILADWTSDPGFNAKLIVDPLLIE